jgi:hypothetical protein
VLAHEEQPYNDRDDDDARECQQVGQAGQHDRRL